MARVLIVGCGCRGRELAAALAADGHAVRGTTRDRSSTRAIEEAGAEAAVADPDRLGTLLPHLHGVSAMCWLMGTATGDEAAVTALHGPRLGSIAAKLVDSHVRGLVYETGGIARPDAIASCERVAATYAMPVPVVDEDPARHEEWVAAMAAGVGRVLAA